MSLTNALSDYLRVLPMGVRVMETTDVDRIVKHSHWHALAGVLVFSLAVVLPREMKFGGVTALALFATGVSTGVLRKWRVEPGLWMLSSLCGAVTAPLCVVMINYEICQCFAGRQPNFVWGRAIGTTLDTLIGTKILWMLTCFLIAVTRMNWRISRELNGNRSRPGEQ